MATKSTGTSSYTFDSLHRPTQSTNRAGQTVGYAYDLAGHLTGLTYPNGKVASRTYDAAGRLVWVADWLGKLTRFTYDADGNLIGERFPNAMYLMRVYDRDDRLVNVHELGGDPLNATDASGRLTHNDICSVVSGTPLTLACVASSTLVFLANATLRALGRETCAQFSQAEQAYLTDIGNDIFGVLIHAESLQPLNYPLDYQVPQYAPQKL